MVASHAHLNDSLLSLLKGGSVGLGFLNGDAAQHQQPPVLNGNGMSLALASQFNGPRRAQHDCSELVPSLAMAGHRRGGSSSDYFFSHFSMFKPICFKCSFVLDQNVAVSFCVVSYSLPFMGEICGCFNN